jgi:hypothetical protein
MDGGVEYVGKGHAHGLVEACRTIFLQECGLLCLLVLEVLMRPRLLLLLCIVGCTERHVNVCVRRLGELGERFGQLSVRGGGGGSLKVVNIIRLLKATDS